MNELIQVHRRLGFALILVFLVGAVAAAVAARNERTLPVARVYARLSVAAAAVQVVLGLVLLALGDRPPVLHFLYGALTLLALPVAILLTRPQAGRREAWMLAAGAVLSLLFAFRALGTG